MQNNEKQTFPEGIINLSGLEDGSKLAYSKYGKHSLMRTLFLYEQDEQNSEDLLFFFLENKLFSCNMSGVSYPKSFWSICDTIYEFDFNIVLYLELIETLVSLNDFNNLIISIADTRKDNFKEEVNLSLKLITELVTKHSEGSFEKQKKTNFSD